MIPSALLVTITLLLALGFWLMGELTFLIPYKAILFREYELPILMYFALLFVNVFAGAFALIRKFFLKDTGRKLLHVDKQLQARDTEMPAPWFDDEVS